MSRSQQAMRTARSGCSGAGDLPIGDYAAIGDCHGAALVSRDGDIDWCCLARFDADPQFCRILDRDRGGFLSVRPSGTFTSGRAYLEGTNILETRFTTAAGVVRVRDFMPVGRRPGASAHDYVDLNAPGWLIRIVEGLEGRVPLQIGYRPSVAFARRPAEIERAAGRLQSKDGPCLYHGNLAFTLRKDVASAACELGAGERLVLVLTAAPVSLDPRERADRLLRITEAFWTEWIGYCRYDGPHRDAVRRSALALKLLTYAPSGAIAAAPTTSLPEEIGGLRNWDYRYCWLRDSAFTLYALAALGYGGEARRFSSFLPQACRATSPELRVMYGVGGEHELREETLDHLRGYKESRPVRKGNGAYRQRQIDVYGEILDWACLFDALGGRFDGNGRKMLAALADHVASHWHEPDQGLWEMRAPPLQHVHGKIMSWVALDRAIRLLGARPDWLKQRELILQDVGRHGLSAPGGHLLQAYGRNRTDAALLVAPMVAFPLASETFEATVAAIEGELRSGDFVYRYLSDDGFTGSEGAFLICSFWLADALLYLGRHGEAKGLLERLIACANDVGLYAEEIDPRTGDFLGNFPQAFTHLALIGTATLLELYERRGLSAIAGSHADRARVAVGATLGWRALWAAFKETRRVGRIFSSRHSILPRALFAQ